MITEDGTGTPGANSYASLTQANDYHEQRLNAAWDAATTEAQTAALIRASDYLDATYRAPGARLSLTQGLQWPLLGEPTVPAAVVAATVILALYALSGPLMAPAMRGVIKTVTILDGLGELDTTYDATAPADAYPAITSLLEGVATVRGVTATAPGSLSMGRLFR